MSSHPCFHLTRRMKPTYGLVNTPSIYPFVFDIMLWRKMPSTSLEAKQLACICGWNPPTWSSLLPSFLPPFFSLILSACSSLLQTAFNKVQPAPPERTPTMSQSNPGKYLQTLSRSPQAALSDTHWRRQVDRSDQTGGKLGQYNTWLKCFNVYRLWDAVVQCLAILYKQRAEVQLRLYPTLKRSSENVDMNQRWAMMQ